MVIGYNVPEWLGGIKKIWEKRAYEAQRSGKTAAAETLVYQRYINESWRRIFLSPSLDRGCALGGGGYYLLTKLICDGG